MVETTETLKRIGNSQTKDLKIGGFMEDFENVLDGTENVDTQTTEENVEGVEITDTTTTEEVVETPVRTFTEEQVAEAIEKRLARERRKFEKTMQEKLAQYQEAENVLKAGLGTENISESTSRLREFYQEQGIILPEPTKPGLSERQIEILAKAEAEEIIDAGYDEMVSEANRLANKGYVNLNAHEKVIFNKLAETLSFEDQKKELKKIGVDPVILEDKNFKDFSKKFKDTNIVEIHNLYNKLHNKPIEKPKPIGSMTNIDNGNAVKDFYTYEESLKFTKSDFDRNPDLFKAVERSMHKW